MKTICSILDKLLLRAEQKEREYFVTYYRTAYFRERRWRRMVRWEMFLQKLETRIRKYAK